MIMSIEEYKKKFIDLFKEMESEHGNVESVEIGTNYVYKNGIGEVVGKDIKCKIQFS